MGDYVLWCLNRVAAWDPAPLMRALSGKRFFRQSHRIRVGHRGAFDRKDVSSGTSPAQAALPALMHEDGECGEYFVPLVVKCVGDPNGFLTRMGDKLTPEGRRRFDALIAHYPEHFSESAPCHWSQYWRPSARMGMFTGTEGPRAHAGLYEVMHAELSAGERAVLVGYSQGGLVAHFLAWMDERLLRPTERCVSGVVTVQAPNQGSPLALHLNEETVAAGLFAALGGIVGYPSLQALPGLKREAVLYPALGAAFRKLAAGTLSVESQVAMLDPRALPPRHFDMGAVSALLEAALADVPDQSRTEVLASARKWLSGLEPTVPSTAFQDLAPSELDRDGSVLNLLATSPLEDTLTAAVIGADTSADDLVRAELPWYGKLLVDLNPNIGGLQDRLQRMSSAYAQLSMNERATGRTLGPREGRLADQYTRGVDVLDPGGAWVTLGAFAHDFVIPSASQALGPRDGERAAPVGFLGNYFNPRGTHLSGAAEDGEGSDAGFVQDALRRMAARLS